LASKRLLLGQPVSLAKTGHLVVRIADPNVRVRPGLKVEDADGNELGKLADIIGNVHSPYAVVRVSNLDAAKRLLDEQKDAYVVIPVRRGRGRKKPKRGRGGARGRQKRGGREGRGARGTIRRRGGARRRSG
jgi:rRNA processing protein Gar1